MLTTTLSIIHAVVSILLIFSVLIHFGKGAEAGLVLDSSSSSILPQKGNVLNKLTSILAAIFLGLSLMLAVMRSHESEKSVFDTLGVMPKKVETSTAAPTATTTAPVDAAQPEATPIDTTSNPEAHAQTSPEQN